MPLYQHQPTRHCATRRFPKRRGAMILEACVSAAMLATLLVVVNQIVVRLHRQTALADQRVVAQQVLENSLERVTIRDWESLDDTALSDLEVSSAAKAKLPQAHLRGTVTDESDPVAAKRITLRLTWQAAAEHETPPLTLTTWVYQPTVDQPKGERP